MNIEQLIADLKSQGLENDKILASLEQMVQERETMLMSSTYHHRSQEYIDLSQSLGEEIERLEDTIATLKDIN